MAEFNSCAKLKESFSEAEIAYKELLENGKNPFSVMYDMQLQLQLELNKKLPKNNPNPTKLETVGEVFDLLRENKQAFDDEYREMIDALPGMSLPEKDRSAVWKRWKAKHDEIRSKKISELSEDDKLELQFELTDGIFFYMNMMLALRVDPKQLFKLYYVKNAENFRRYKNNY